MERSIQPNNCDTNKVFPSSIDEKNQPTYLLIDFKARKKFPGENLQKIDLCETRCSIFISGK